MVFTIGDYQLVLFQVRRRADGPAAPSRGVSSAAEIERRMQEHRNTVVALWQMQPR